jgi:hypothetical protein
MYRTTGEMTDSELAREVPKHSRALNRPDSEGWARESLERHLGEMLTEQAERVRLRTVSVEQAAREYPDTWTRLADGTV